MSLKKYTLHNDDNMASLKEYPGHAFDAIVTDPPYGLSKPIDIFAVLDAWMSDRQHYNGKGFMSREWDSLVPPPFFWREALRVLKPGAFLLAFSGARNYDLMALSIRMGGFEIRDTISWIYGSGMPSGNVNVETHVNKRGGDGSKYKYWGTRLCPAQEPIVVARRPIEGTLADNVMAFETGALNLPAAHIPTDDPESLYTKPHSKESLDFNRVQFQKSTMIGSVTDRYKMGRWPKNVIFEEDDDALSGLPQDARKYFYCSKVSKKEREAGLDHLPHKTPTEINSRKDGSVGLEHAAAGAGRTTGAKNHHPTLKPIDLMRYLCKMATPPSGTILDPFMGSGSTGIAALLEGFSFVGMEQDAEYYEIAKSRINHWTTEGSEK